MDHAALLDALAKPVAVIASSLDVRYANPAFARLLGVRPTGDVRAIGAAVRRLAPLCDQLAQADFRLFSSGDLRTFRWPIDGDNERIYDVTVSRFGDDAVLLVADEVSDAAQAEEMYARTRSYFYGVLHSLNLGIIVLDERFRVTFANEDQGRGLAALGVAGAPIDLIGRGVAEAYPILTEPEWNAAFRAVIEEGRPVSHRRLPLGTEPPTWCALSVLPFAESRGGTRGAVVVTEDVTRLVRLEKQLVHRERQAMVGQVAIALNHEINNPLAGILGNAELARSRPGLDRAVADMMQVIIDQTQRIAAVTLRLRQIEEDHLTEYGVRNGPMMLDLRNIDPTPR